ncbi:MAG: hypothetical protein P8J27_02065 [Mariniblastus sp.]|nr:hypothetical protein [Mariniblastus sp.]
MTQPMGSASVSLLCLFQVITACCIFFACLRISPLFAFIGTVIVAPAIIRTGIASELHRQNGMTFDWGTRVRSFLDSIMLVVVTLAFSAIVFTVVSVVFGCLWVCIAVAMGAKDMLVDIAFVGTVGGMIWGLLGAVLSFGVCAGSWKPKLMVLEREEATELS